MADGTNYLGLRVSPLESGYGIGAQTLGQALPSLINPYGKVGTNIGVALGGALLQGLMAYQARQQATEQSILANRLGTQMLGITDPAERLKIAEGVGDTAVQSRLLGLNERLLEQQIAREQAAAAKVAELKAGAEFQLGDLGTKVFERQQKAELNKVLAAKSPKEAKDWWESLGVEQRGRFTSVVGQADALRNLAQKFRDNPSYGLALRAKSLKPGSPADLAFSEMKALVPSTVKTLGDTGNLAQEEQQRVLDATLGSVLSGSESIASRLDQLADLVQTKVGSQMKSYKLAAEQGPEALLAQIERKPESDAKKRNAELKAEVKRLEALVAGRK